MGSVRDECGVCGGNGKIDYCGLCLPVDSSNFNQSCAGCDGIPTRNSSLRTERDACGICGGDGSFDSCGVCLPASASTRDACKSAVSSKKEGLLLISLVTIVAVIAVGMALLVKQRRNYQSLEHHFSEFRHQFIPLQDADDYAGSGTHFSTPL